MFVILGDLTKAVVGVVIETPISIPVGCPTMPRTVLENLLVMAPQVIAIWILILLTVLGLFLGACAFLLVTGWRIDKRHKASLSGASRKG